jgi:hypothetical protein
MRMPRVRFTMRWMMILVAVVAVILGGDCYRLRLLRLRETYRREVERHGRAATWYQKSIDVHPAFIQELRRGGLTGDVLRTYGTAQDHVPHRDHHRAMERKYQRAFDRPWLAVEPDPRHFEPVLFGLSPKT